MARGARRDGGGDRQRGLLAEPVLPPRWVGAASSPAWRLRAPAGDTQPGNRAWRPLRRPDRDHDGFLELYGPFHRERADVLSLRRDAVLRSGPGDRAGRPRRATRWLPRRAPEPGVSRDR